MINPLLKPSEKAPKSNPNLPVLAFATRLLVSAELHSHGFRYFTSTLAPIIIVTMPKAIEEYIWKGEIAALDTNNRNKPLNKPTNPPINA
jgi:hypothetical protein